MILSLTRTNQGSLAYVGNAAIFDFNGMSFSGGLLAVYLWRSIYFAQSVSFRTRVLLAMDWSKRALFGRGSFKSQVLSDLTLKTDGSYRPDELLTLRTLSGGLPCIKFLHQSHLSGVFFSME